MSFDVYLLRFREGQQIELDRERGHGVLTCHRFEDYADGRFDVQFADGSHVEFDGKGITTDEKPDCWCFYIRNMSDSVIGFVFEVAQTTDAVMFASMPEAPCIVLRSDQRDHLPAALTDKIVECRSVDELHRLFTGGYEAWRTYRNYVVEKFSDGQP